MKTIVILYVLLFSSSFYGQFYESEYQKTRLYFKNGDSINGFSKIDEENRLFFKKERNSKKVRYSHKELTGIKMFKDDKTKTFKYKLLASVGPLLLRVENQENLKMQLYSQSFFASEGSPGGFTNGVYSPGFSTGKTIEVKRYYINKKNSKLSVQKIWSDTNGRKNKEFRNRIVKYFKDCKPLVVKIKNGQYHRFQMLEIVDFYNFNCSK